MSAHEQRERLRAILAGDRFVSPASVYDPLTARAAEALGYEMMMFAGSTASLTVLAAPDLVVLTLSEFVEQARRITRAGTLPLMVDADHGYGNALNVMRCVQELETAGISAMSIEDTVLPRAFGAAGETFLSVEEGTGKMRAALSARTDPSTVIYGRTSAIRAEGIESVLRRAKAYEAAGVDGLFFVGLSTRAELEAIRAQSALPFVLGSATPELSDPVYLASQGVRIGGWSHAPLQAAARAAYDSMRGHRESTAPGVLPPALDPKEFMAALTAQSDYDQATVDYLR
ncbi:MAG: oxaloacetate decarboxylase [Chloroflexota bacterium]